MPQPAGELPPVDVLDAAAEEAIALCDGDARAAVRALVVANNHLEDELAMMRKELGYFRVAISSGYSRQWHHRRWGIEEQPDVEAQG